MNQETIMERSGKNFRKMKEVKSLLECTSEPY